MKLTQEKYNSILKIIGKDFQKRTVKIGSLIYSSSSSIGTISIVTKGSIRIIDNFKIFNSQTLLVDKAPYFLGFSEFLDNNLNEVIRANEECEIISFNSSEIEEAKRNLIFKLLKFSISPYEIVYIKKILDGNNLINSLLIKKQYNEIFKNSNIVTKFEKISENGILIYLDNPYLGFSYGQVITKEICKKFFLKYLPRILEVKVEGYKTSKGNEEIKLNILNNSDQNNIQKNTNKSELIVDEDIKRESREKNINEKEKNHKTGFNLIRGKNREESYYASILMLVNYFDMPTQSESIKRGAKIIEQQKKSYKLNLVTLLDRYGLSVRIININMDNPLLLPSPSIWIDQDNNCNLILKTTTRFLYLFSPITGMNILNIEEARKRFKEEHQLITVEVGLNTPKKRFNLGWMIPYVKKFRSQLIEVFAASFLTQLFQLATPMLFQQIIDRVLSKGATNALTPLVILMVLFALLEIIFSSLRTFQFVEISNRIDIGIGSAILSRMLRLNARFFDSRPVGELSSRLNELQNIRSFLTGTALTVVLDAIFSALYFSVMIFYSPLLTSIVLISIPLLFLVTVGVTPITQRLIRLRAEAQARTNALLVEILGGIHTIKLQNAEFNARRQWEDRHLGAINQGFKAILANTSSQNAGQLINKLSNISVIGIGAWLVIKNEITLGQLIAFRIISGMVTAPMLRLSGSWQQFQEMSLSLQRVGDIVNQPLEVLENEDKNIDMPEIKGSILAKDLCFSYSSTAQPVLNSINLEITEGSFVGLVGQSGCGKSSFLKMIPRLYRPSAGKLMIDNFDITKVDLYTLRKQIGFVPQDCMLFEGTVFSNIALGNPESSAEDVVNASKSACAHDFIMNLPYGYGTPIGEKGSGLSGGQRQRVALARMLLENPNLVVLDEATSALDVDTEKQVVKNLRKEFKGRTLLMITHRLSSIVDADKIVVMHQGKIDSIGSHENLMKERGRYYALYQTQFNEN